MIKFITDQQEGEPDILSPVKNETLIITDLEKKELARFSPVNGPWTQEKLERVAEDLYDNRKTRYGADAYLGTQWVGSTEV
ncbi:hypothetical protein R50073_50250 (plasmid) [Maricurvus nonylphenolicus]|jgi:hypothetical protein|uniref:hypothetical protein n=1 Tax=Maricurvus nonylphenolicus TaxID=1008307 RepID=UPI0036F35844